PFPSYEVLFLAPVVESVLLQRRTERISQLAFASEQFAGADESFIIDCVNNANRAFVQAVQGLAAGSARRELTLWKKTLVSTSLHEQYLAEGPTFSNYQIHDAMLTGEYLVFNGKDHIVLN